MPKGSEMEMTGSAQHGDVSIEREIWVHDDIKTGNLIRKFNLGVRYVGRCGMECLKCVLKSMAYESSGKGR